MRYGICFLLVLTIGACGKEPQQSVVSLDEEGFSAAILEEVLRAREQEQREFGGQAVLESGSISDGRRNAITRAVEAGSPAVVSITVTERIEGRGTLQDDFFRYFFGQGVPHEFTSIGSGFLISEDGLIVTNQHVVGGVSEAQVNTLDGRSFPAKLIGSDELTDLALLKIDVEEPLPYLEFSDSDDVIVGEWAIAIGNPFGLFEDGYPGVSVGVVSAKNRDFRPDPNNPRVYIDMIQTDAAINRGNSGGPLLNSEGRVIGVNSFIFTGGTSSGFVGLGFAIPSNRVERIINQLLTSGEVALDYDPGMEFTSMTEQLVYNYRLPAIQGLLVTRINRGGPAFEAGLMPGDIILRIGDERVLSEMHARAMLREYYEGDEMELTLLRDGTQYTTTLLLRKRAVQPEP
ncbi:MAG: trypsin-like peptidase domain-containing protein [Balneolaceae bacterium]